MGRKICLWAGRTGMLSPPIGAMNQDGDQHVQFATHPRRPGGLGQWAKFEARACLRHPGCSAQIVALITSVGPVESVMLEE